MKLVLPWAVGRDQMNQGTVGKPAEGEAEAVTETLQQFEGGGISVPAPLGAVADFAISSLVAIVSFLAIYVGALSLAFCIHRLNEFFGAAKWLADVAEFVERILVYVDVGLLLIFLAFEILGYVRNQWREFQEG